jgi:hypothetical protein
MERIAIGAFQVHVTALSSYRQSPIRPAAICLSEVSLRSLLGEFGKRCPNPMCGVHAQTFFAALVPSPVQVEPLVVKIHGCIQSQWLLQRSPDWASHGRRSLPKYCRTSLCPLCEQASFDLVKSCCERPCPCPIQRLRSKLQTCLW